MGLKLGVWTTGTWLSASYIFIFVFLNCG